MPTTEELRLDRSRQAFLAEVARRVRSSLAAVDFAGILDTLIEWSNADGRSLSVRDPLHEHKVSFASTASGYVLWSAYPRNDDGAKVVVLPKLFRGITSTNRQILLKKLKVAVPTVKIEGSGTLQVPMHLLTAHRATIGFRALLDAASDIANSYGSRRQ